MMTKFEADNDKLDRELSVASKKYMKLQKEFLRQITQDIDDLAKEATSELMSSIDSTPNFNLQERKIRVSKEELVSLISEQIKNDTRTHRVNKHHLIELIAEETNKQVSRKK